MNVLSICVHPASLFALSVMRMRLTAGKTDMNIHLCKETPCPKECREIAEVYKTSTGTNYFMKTYTLKQFKDIARVGMKVKIDDFHLEYTVGLITKEVCVFIARDGFTYTYPWYADTSITLLSDPEKTFTFTKEEIDAVKGHARTLERLLRMWAGEGMI